MNGLARQENRAPRYSHAQWCVEIAKLEVEILNLRGQALMDGQAAHASFAGQVRELLSRWADRAEQLAMMTPRREFADEGLSPAPRHVVD